MQAVLQPKHWPLLQKFSECFYIEQRLIAKKAPLLRGFLLLGSGVILLGYYSNYTYELIQLLVV